MWNGDCTADGCRRERVDSGGLCSKHKHEAGLAAGRELQRTFRAGLIAERMGDVKFRYAIEATIMRRSWPRRRRFLL